MFELVLAFLLDLLLGDPVYALHPVRLMGRGIASSENFLRSRIQSERTAGAVLAVFFPLFVFLASWLLIAFLYRLHFALGWTASLYGIYSALSVRDLRDEGLRIYKDLLKRDLERARRALARIVGRDTQALTEEEIIRAGVETIAESTVDGIIAPLFYAAVGGAPLALTYKAINTLDSMIGHKNVRYLEFGMAAAKQDDAWNWIPARISYYVIAVAALIFNRRIKEASFVGWEDGMIAGYGNSAIPEAAFAGALGLRLGGPSSYEGRLEEKPLLGFPVKNFDCEDLIKSMRLMLISAWISLLFAVAVRYAMTLCIQLIS